MRTALSIILAMVLATIISTPVRSVQFMIPTDISGCKAWYRVQDLGLNNGDNMTTLSDRSGAGGPSLALTTGTPCVYSTTALAKPGSTSSGADTNHAFLSSTTAAETAIPFTMVTVFKQSSANAASGFGVIAQCGEALYLQGTTRHIGSATFGTYTNNTAEIWVGVVRSTTGTLWVNGSSLGTVSNAYNAPTGNTSIGGINGANNFTLTGTVGEFVVYNKELSTTEIGNITAYLSSRYGISTTSYSAARSPLGTGP